MFKTLHVTDRDAWRKWLEKHHGSETEIWLIYYKKHTGERRIPYEHAVEEALFARAAVQKPTPVRRAMLASQT